MKTDNASIVHRWAQQTGGHGRTSNGNLSFDGPSLYSYRTEIARFIEGRVVYTVKRYSVTTSGKHQNKIPQAISQYEAYSTNADMRVFSNRWSDCRKILLSEYRESLLATVGKLRTAKSVYPYLQDIRATALTLRRLGDKRKMIAELCGTSLGTHNIIARYFKIDLRAKMDRAIQSEIKKRKAVEEKEKEALAKWRNGETCYTRLSTTALRLRNDCIETTHGAKISRQDAIRLYDLIKLDSLEPGYTVGEFTVRELTDTHLIIGCHTIPLEEIHAIAALLGLKTAA